MIAVKTAIALQTFIPSKQRRLESNPDHTDKNTLPLHSYPAPIPIPSLSPDCARPSTGNSSVPTISPGDSAESLSPVITTLNADLSSAQATISELKTALFAHEETIKDAHAHLQSTLEELRNRRKEDDAERQELKTKTKSLEEQKRQAEAVRRDTEKKLRVAEGIRDGLETKISAAFNEIGDLKGNIADREKNIGILGENGARFVADTREAVESWKSELALVEVQLTELEGSGEGLVRQVKEAENNLQAVLQQGEEARRVGPEAEMMMMAAAYEAAAQEGYLYGHQHSQSNHWANQAAAYMAEAGMPYLDQTYTARPTHSTNRMKIADLGVFEDFGPVATHHTVMDATTPPISDAESDIFGQEPGLLDNGTSTSFPANLLPQGLFRSLEGDQMPLGSEDDEQTRSFTLEEAPHSSEPSNGEALGTVDAHDSGSESSEEHDIWRSPVGLERGTKREPSTRLAVPITTPPGATSLPGLPALPGSRRWFSGTTSADNVNAFSFMQPTSTTSNDSLNLAGAYESSPFAPSASEKKALALKWGPLSKYRWAGANRDAHQESSLSQSERSERSERSSSVNSVAPGSGWLASRFGNASGNGNADLSSETVSKADTIAVSEQSREEDERQEKKPFRFFSLRKPRE